MEKVFETDPCVLGSTVDDSFFSFTDSEKKSINDRARNRYQGFNTVDMGCGLAQSSVDVNTLLEVNDDLDNTNPTEINNVIEQTINRLSDVAASDVDDSDKENVKTGFSTNFIKELPKIFTDIIFTPKIMVLYQVTHALFRGSPMTTTTSSNFAFDNKVFFTFVTRESMAALLEIVFQQLKREVLRIVADFAIELIAEQSDLKLKSILSITYGVTEGTLSLLPTPNTSEFN